MKFLILLMALLLLPACCDQHVETEHTLRMKNMRLDNDLKAEKLRIIKLFSTNIPVELLLEENEKCPGRELSEQNQTQQKNNTRAATGALMAHQVVRSNAARSRGHH